MSAVALSAHILWNRQCLLVLFCGWRFNVEACWAVTGFALFIGHVRSSFNAFKTAFFSVSRGVATKALGIMLFSPHFDNPKIS